MEKPGTIAYKAAKALLEEGEPSREAFLEGHAERLLAVKNAVGMDAGFRWKVFGEYAFLVMYSEDTIHDERARGHIESLINISFSPGRGRYNPGAIIETYNTILRLNEAMTRQMRGALLEGYGHRVERINVQAITLGLDESGKVFAHFHQPIVSYLSLIYWDLVREEDMRVLLGFQKHHWEVERTNPAGMIRVQGDLMVEVTRLNTRIQTNRFAGILYTARWLPTLINEFEDRARQYVRQNLERALYEIQARAEEDEEDVDLENRLIYYYDEDEELHYQNRIIVNNIVMGLRRALEDTLTRLPGQCESNEIVNTLTYLLYNIFNEDDPRISLVSLILLAHGDDLYSLAPILFFMAVNRDPIRLPQERLTVSTRTIIRAIVDRLTEDRRAGNGTVHEAIEELLEDVRGIELEGIVEVQYGLLPGHRLLRIYSRNLYNYASRVLPRPDWQAAARREPAPDGSGRQALGGSARDLIDSTVFYIHGFEENYERIVRVLCPGCGPVLDDLVVEAVRYSCYMRHGSEGLCREALLGEKRTSVVIAGRSVTVDYTIPYRLYATILLLALRFAGSSCPQASIDVEDDSFDIRIGEHTVEVLGGRLMRDPVVPLALSREWLRHAYRDLEEGRLHVAAARLLSVKSGEPILYVENSLMLYFEHPEHDSRGISVGGSALVRVSLLPGVPYRVMDGILYIEEVEAPEIENY